MNHEGHSVPVDEDFLSEPVLVYGPRKGGTTLLQNLLDGGSEMLMLPGELKLKVFVRKPGRAKTDLSGLFMKRGRSFFPVLFQCGPDSIQAREIYDKKIAGLSQEAFEGLLDPRKYAAGLTHLLARKADDLGEIIKADVAAFVAALHGGRGKARRWASKEVGGDPTAIMELFHRIFPRGRVVFLVRQPEFIVRSILSDRKRKGESVSVRQIFHECRDAQRIVNYGYEHALAKELVVAYEQLTADTSGEIQRICQSLGMPFEDIFTGPTTLGQPVVVATSSRNTQQVFRQEVRWQSGLSWRERLVIRMFKILGPPCYLLSGRKFVRYEDLISALNAQKR